MKRREIEQLVMESAYDVAVHRLRWQEKTPDDVRCRDAIRAEPYRYCDTVLKQLYPQAR